MSRYTVKQVAALTGIPAATLRAWERRYAVVEPQRAASGYRLYGDHEVARLTRMAELVAAGSPASLAAQEVVRTLPAPPERFEGAVPERLSRGLDRPGGPDPDLLVEAARTFDPVLLDRVLDEAFARGSFENVVEGWLMPALGDLGDAWSEGRVDVAGEHFVSGAVHRRLAHWFEAAGAVPGAPVVLVGLPAGAFHQLAAIAFATFLRRNGMDVRYLGADVPEEGWSRAVEQLRPAAAVVGVPTLADAESAVAALRAIDGAAVAMVGGAGAEAVAEAATAVVVLPAGLTDAVVAVGGAVRQDPAATAARA